MAWELRKTRCRTLVVAFEDESSRVLTPVLKLLAATTRAKELVLADPDGTLRAVPRVSVLRDAAELTLASAASATAAAACALAPTTGTWQPGRPEPGRRVSRNSALYLNSNLWFGLKAGGSVGHISGVANGLMDAGVDLSFATCGGRLLVDERARLVPLRVPSAFGLPFELNYYRFSRMVVNQLRSELSTGHYAFIYQRLSLADSSGARLARESGVPLVAEYNGSEVWVARHWGRPLRFERLARRAEDSTLGGARLIVTVSEVLGDELRARGVAPERVLVYPNCVDPARFDPSMHDARGSKRLRRDHGIPEDAIVITFVGTFGPWHGARVLAAAIRDLIRSESALLRQRRLHFLLVGDGAEMTEVRRILSEPTCDEFVTMTGLVPQEEAPSFLAASDILVAPHVANADGSRFFGSPTKLFEYMAMEKPIIASELEQMADVLSGSPRIRDLPAGALAEAGDAAALFCTPGSVADLTRAILFISSNRAFGKALAVNARRRVLRHYTWQRHVEAILDRLRHLGVPGLP
jgi:glycosyltransferase involved in cell wall biosynthesis